MQIPTNQLHEYFEQSFDDSKLYMMHAQHTISILIPFINFHHGSYSAMEFHFKLY